MITRTALRLLELTIMITSLRPLPPLTNLLLAALPADDLKRLTLGADRVRLATGKMLFEAGEEVRYAYFPLSGMVSLVSATSDTKSVEVAAVGREGMVGLPVVFRADKSPYSVMAQLPGDAIRVGAKALRSEFDRGGRLHDLLLRHAFALLTQVTQSATCHRFHTVEHRLAHWLLVARDRAGTDSFRLTQEFLSYMLGVPRTSVTAFASKMQSRKLIGYSRGRITILDARRLKASSCACYRIVAREHAALHAA